MASFFGKLKSGSDTKSLQNGLNSSSKKDPNATQLTPLERMLRNAGPIRVDGSDKFFGLENFGNTCYCNSILQCLFYTPQFREQVLTYPRQADKDGIAKAAANAPPRNRTTQPSRPAQAQQPGQQAKLEDKESPDYKKKIALAAGPIVNMSYRNSASYDMEESIYSSLKDIFEAIVVNQNRYGIVSPVKFLEVLRKENEMFRSAMHQDAHEFFNLVLNSAIDTIEEYEKKEVKPNPKENSVSAPFGKPENSAVSWPSVLPTPTQSQTKWLRDLFEGTMTSETRCLTCEIVSQRDEAFLDLSVDLEQHTSVTSCLNRFSEEEMLCERNKFHCDHCGGLQEAEKRMKIKKLPEILTLHLKRFKYTEDLQRLQKLHHKVVYPYHLRLFNTTDDAEDPDRLYELYAVVVHIGGGPYHGHYVSIIKTQDRGWLLFDDEMVEPVDQSYVRNFFGDKQGMASAYVLFYRRTTAQDVQREKRMMNKKHNSQSITEKTALKAKESVELHRVQNTSPQIPPIDTGSWSNLDHALKAPHIIPVDQFEPPKAINANTAIPTSPSTQTKKEKAKEEKERKAAEKAAEKAADKEREKVEKVRRREMEQKGRDIQKKQVDELKMTADTVRAPRIEDEYRNGTPDSASKESLQINGLSSSSKDLFRRSKSFKFSSLGKKDKPPLPEDAFNGTAVDDSTSEVKDDDKDTRKEVQKKNRFSLRKKSFGLV